MSILADMSRINRQVSDGFSRACAEGRLSRSDPVVGDLHAADETIHRGLKHLRDARSALFRRSCLRRDILKLRGWESRDEIARLRSEIAAAGQAAWEELRLAREHLDQARRCLSDVAASFNSPVERQVDRCRGASWL